jgi:hypothetical protein
MWLFPSDIAEQFRDEYFREESVPGVQASDIEMHREDKINYCYERQDGTRDDAPQPSINDCKKEEVSYSIIQQANELYNSM